MKKSRFAAGAVGALACAALMIPAVHAQNDEHRRDQPSEEQRKVDERMYDRKDDKAGKSDERGVRERAGDQMLETRVKTALIGNDSTKARNIEVEVRDGVVHLQGRVESAAEEQAAVQAAKDIDGVREVRSSLTHGPAK